MRVEGTAAANETAIGGAPLDDATKPGSRAQAARFVVGSETAAQGASATRDVRIESLDELVEFFTAAGKKGVAVNRYKGLGEMNPDTLWETTMNPETAHRSRRSAPRITWKRT